MGQEAFPNTDILITLKKVQKGQLICFFLFIDRDIISNLLNQFFFHGDHPNRLA